MNTFSHSSSLAAEPQPTLGFLPVSQQERCPEIDVLRGTALAGVLLVNLLTCFRISLFAHIAGSDAPLGPGGQAISSLLSTFVEFKAITLFSFLFGVGIAVQAGRMSTRTNIHVFLIRRFGVLCIIGLVHMILLWDGDILTLYAICGWMAIPMLGFSVRALAAIGALLTIGSAYLNFPVHLPDAQGLALQASVATRIYSQGTFLELFSFRLAEIRDLIVPLLTMTIVRTLGLILLGIAAQKADFLRTKRVLLVHGLLWGSVVGYAATRFNSDVASLLAISFAYLCAILLWVPRSRFLAAGGQMALTNYLAQSLVFGLGFYSYGFRQFGRLELWPCAVAGLAFYVLQLGLSRWWLRRFYFGPCEWLWRSITYLCPQLMKRPKMMA